MHFNQNLRVNCTASPEIKMQLYFLRISLSKKNGDTNLSILEAIRLPENL